MADKEKKDKKEKKVVNPTEGQTSVQTSAEEVAPVEKVKKKAEPKPESSVKPAKAPKAAKPDAKAKEGDSVDGIHLKHVPGNSKTPEEVKPEVKQVVTPPREEIARLAHHFWKERGSHHGSHDQDWLRAEQQLRGKAS